MAESITSAEVIARQEQHLDEKVLHKRVQWFTEKWTTALDLNKRDSSEFAADFTMVVQAVHKDATRDISAILTRIMMAVPPQPMIIPKSGT